MVDPDQDNKPLFTIGTGSSPQEHYGIDFASRLLLLPTELIDNARKIAQQLKENQARSVSQHQNKKATTTFQLAQRLLSLKNSSLSEDALRSYLLSLRKLFFENGEE